MISYYSGLYYTILHRTTLYCIIIEFHILYYITYISPLKFAPRGWAYQSVGCPAYTPTKWYGDTYKMVAPMGVAAYKMVAPGYPTCPPTSNILG